MCVIVSVGSMPLPRPWGIWSVYRIIRMTRVFTQSEKEVEPNYSRSRRTRVKCGGAAPPNKNPAFERPRDSRLDLHGYDSSVKIRLCGST